MEFVEAELDLTATDDIIGDIEVLIRNKSINFDMRYIIYYLEYLDFVRDSENPDLILCYFKRGHYPLLDENDEKKLVNILSRYAVENSILMFHSPFYYSEYRIEPFKQENNKVLIKHYHKVLVQDDVRILDKEGYR